MEGFEERFQQLIDEFASGNRSLFSRNTGKQASHAADICKGKAKPSFEYLQTLVKKFHISLDWLIKGEGSMDQKSSFDEEDNYVLVPRYDVQASAGYGSLIQSEQIVDYLAFKRSWVASDLRMDPTELVLITVQGDSMEPTLFDGDLILVDLNENQLRRDAIYVLRVDEALMAKRIQRIYNGGLNIISDNQTYAPFTISREETDTLKVLGRVVWVGRAL